MYAGQPRAADDFATIRARIEELRRERAREEAGQTEVQSDSADASLPKHLLTGPNRDRRSGPIHG